MDTVVVGSQWGVSQVQYRRAQRATVMEKTVVAVISKYLKLEEKYFSLQTFFFL